MTPEELFRRIENAHHALIENQALFFERLRAHEADEKAARDRHDKEIAEVRELQNVFAVGMVRLQEAQTRNQARNELEIQELRELHKRTQETLDEAGEKLNALIETVDRIIRERNKEN
jgi:hypothetical protein